jgi:hypothetical protein
VAFFYSATLQLTQWIINAAYSQRSLQSTPLLTAWINHQIWGQYMFGTPERLSAFGAHTFPTVITTSGVQDVDWRWLYDALIIHCVACFVAEPIFWSDSLFPQVLRFYGNACFYILGSFDVNWIEMLFL